MKFLLTILICSSVSGDCFVHKDYPKEQEGYYNCVRAGLSESYDILYLGQFTEKEVVSLGLYPRFSCEKKIVPLPKPAIQDEKPASLSAGTILRGIFRLVSYSIN
jgi:hypothetical protein|tara:strand:- start:2247 stop:2561 length:315 start_codon:yes stop_codon:yes gene_type:complete